MLIKHSYLIVLLVAGLSIIGCQKTQDEPIDDEMEVPVDLSGIIFTSNSDGSFQIWKLRHEEQTQLTKDLSKDAWWGRYSPENQQILYYSSANGRDINDYASASLKVIDIDGGNGRTVLQEGAHGWEQHGLANWSYDGSKIVMAAVDPDIGKWQIYITDATGENPVRVSTRDEADFLDPIFSPDDASIICVTTPEGVATTEDNYEIVRINIQDGAEERLTYNERRDHHPCISPDGTHVIYESLVAPDYLSIGKWALMEVNLTSGNEREVLNNDQINLFPRYAPDGESVIYTQLNIESFSMTLGRLNLPNDEAKLLLPEDAHHMNGDPF